MGIGITRVTDHDGDMECVIKDILPTIVEDGTPCCDIGGYIDVRKDCWLRIKWHNDLLGFVKFSVYNKSMIEIHPFIIPAKRRWSEKAIAAALEYISGTDYASVITNIPSCKRYALLFARKMGFKEVGRFVKGFNKEHDMVMFQKGL